MAFALVASTERAGAGTSPAVDTTGADLLVAVLSAGATLSAPSDSKGNTWTKLNTYTGSFSSELAIYYVAAPTVGSGHTFTANGSTPGLCVAAFSGAATSGPFDEQNGQVEGASPRSTGSVTPTENDELVVAGAGGLYSGGSIGAGFTVAQDVNIGPGANFGSALAYLIQTTAAGVNPAWTSANDCSAAIATFKAATSPPPPPPPPPPPRPQPPPPPPATVPNPAPRMLALGLI